MTIHMWLKTVLFTTVYEAIRIIQEMRSATNGEYLKYIVWENVPGAFTSNKGQDFRAVLSAIAQMSGETAEIPISPNGKWFAAGTVMGDSYSIAWRVLDAQWWGVPQRRRRIFLVADCRGNSAPKILFESEGLYGYSPQSEKPEQTVTEAITGCFDAPDDFVTETKESSQFFMGFDGYNSKVTGDVISTLGVNCGMSTGRAGLLCLNDIPIGSGINIDVSYTLNTVDQHAIVSSNVRRLMPIECCRLQGFYDWWCDNLHITEPSEDEITYWLNVWETYRTVTNAYKNPKTRSQIEKWLKNPYSDEEMYVMWGNGVALPCVSFILWAIKQEAKMNGI